LTGATVFASVVVVGRDDPNDRLEGPGWRDHLVDRPEPFAGDDRLLLGERKHKAARTPWHRVLAGYLDEWDGGTVDSLAGDMGWFNLRLTRQEVRNLIDSAKNADPALIKLGSPVSAEMEPLPAREVKWVATEKGRELGYPRGASGADMRAALPHVVRTTGGKLLGSLTWAGAIGGAIGLAITAGTPEAIAALLVGIWITLFALVWGSLRDERGLTAMVRAWPRLEAYRPCRWKFETATLRTPGPYALLAAATLGLAFAGFAAFRADGRFTGVSWIAAVICAASALAVIALAYAGWHRRSKRMQADYVDEYLRQRKPESQR
jgi:hypothetical protein